MANSSRERIGGEGSQFGRASILPWIGISVLLLALFASDGLGDRPNIIILLADDLGYGELGCQGNEQIPTPHIDSIAANGVRFTSGYVTASYCSASRAGLMTGRYQARFGYDDNPTGARNELPNAGLPKSQKTLGERLQDVGYATAIVGKWHLGGTAPFHPLRRGFDEFFGFTHEGHYFVPPPYRGVTTMLRRRTLPDGSKIGELGNNRWTSQDGRLILSSHMGNSEPDYDANNPIVRQSQPVKETAYLTDALTREAIDFIDRHKSRPFFLYLAYNAVHSPLQGAEKYMKKFERIDDVHRRIFAAMLASLDDSVGTVLGKLESEDLLENTIVFFLSDNGGPTRELTSSNRPLRGEKGRLYEGGTRVPFLMQWPGKVSDGQTFDRPVVSLDIAATTLKLSKAKPDPKADGVDLMPFVTGERSDSPHEELFWRMNRRMALRQGDWKVIQHDGSGQRWELYNLADDLSEQHDLATEFPDKLKSLVSRWEKVNSEMAEPVRW